MKEEEIALSEEHPELDSQHVGRVIRRHGLKPAPPKAEGEVLRRFGSLRARMAEANADLSENEVAAEVEAARSEIA